MKQDSHGFGRNRLIALALMTVLFLSGIMLAARTTVQTRRVIFSENDRQLSELADNIDHNVTAVIDRCREELSGLINSESFIAAENGYFEGGDKTSLIYRLNKCAILTTEYAERIVVFKNGEVLLSSTGEENPEYTFLTDNDGDDIWVCLDNSTDTSYIALSYCSEKRDCVYFVLLDPELFFKRVAVDTMYDNHWVILFDDENGMALYNDGLEPDIKLLSVDELVNRGDGYTVIYEHQRTGETGVSIYKYTDKTGKTQTIRIFVLPASKTKNGALSVAVAVYNNVISGMLKRLNINTMLSAVLVAFSAAAAAFLLLHSGKREMELANELAAIEKEKQLNEELVKSQELLVHRQKLETIGTLTAGIAHEFNNLLSPIMGNSMLILEKSRTTDQEIFNNALDVYLASDRAKELVQQISRLSRRQSVTQMNPITPEKLVEDVLSMSAAYIPVNITVKKYINTNSLILGDESQLGHMLLNLVINGVQAMKPDGGTLTVTAWDDGCNISVSVSDTGSGIPEENLSSIFDPFFTTKEAGKGTGLGLSIAQRTAINHGGSIKAENNPYGGAKFTFTTQIFRQ